jgi:hypothetical protein
VAKKSKQATEAPQNASLKSRLQQQQQQQQRQQWLWIKRLLSSAAIDAQLLYATPSHFLRYAS